MWFPTREKRSEPAVCGCHLRVDGPGDVHRHIQGPGFFPSCALDPSQLVSANWHIATSTNPKLRPEGEPFLFLCFFLGGGGPAMKKKAICQASPASPKWDTPVIEQKPGLCRGLQLWGPLCAGAGMPQEPSLPALGPQRLTRLSIRILLRGCEASASHVFSVCCTALVGCLRFWLALFIAMCNVQFIAGRYLTSTTAARRTGAAICWYFVGSGSLRSFCPASL